MTHWMCANCGYYSQASIPPGECPGCKQACTFSDITCYRPECGGEQNLDPLLVEFVLSRIRGKPAQAVPKPAPAVAEVVAVGERLKWVGEEQKQLVRGLERTATEAVAVRVLFDGLGEEQRQLVRSLGRTKTYATNVVICSKGAEANELYLVEEGQVNVQSGAEEGVHINISVVSAGEAFAWSALVPPYRLTATVVATSPTRVLAIERHKLLTAMRDDSFLALTLMQNVARIAASRLHNLEQELVAILRR